MRTGVTAQAALPRRMVVLGGSGLVGSRLVRAWQSQTEVVAPTHAELDVLDQAALASYLHTARPEVVVNAVAWADVDGAETQSGDRSGLVYRLNASLPEQLGQITSSQGAYLLHVSTDYVFDGTQAERPYREDDAVRPLCWYAQSKADGEGAVAQTAARSAAIVRIEMPFTASADAPKGDVSRIFKDRLQARQPVVAVMDQKITPILLDDVVAAFDAIVRARFTGLLHVAATSHTTPFDYARAVAARLSCDGAGIQPSTFVEFGRTRAAARPQHSWMDVSRFEREFGRNILRSFDAQLDAWSVQVTATA
ncbi:MAG: dTDP-4-dehydrorhamnose reductase [Chloroflexota bacterium]